MTASTELPQKPEKSTVREASVEEVANRLNPKSAYYEFSSEKGIRYALFLGAGASVESGVKSAGQMIDDFINTIYEIKCIDKKNNPTKDKWIKDRWLKDNKEYKSRKNKYSLLFAECYPKAVTRREYIESTVDNKNPSKGYIFLTHLFIRKIVDTIITTNFDDLVYQACTSYSNIRPIVSSLGSFVSDINSTKNRPKVLKIHGDFLFSRLKTTKKELKNQDPNMSNDVKHILKSYDGLIVIGYSGNDDSIIKLLHSIPENKFLYWCVYKDEKINKKVQNLLIKKRGWIVRTNGFDELFDAFRRNVGIEDSDIFSLFEERKKALREKIKDVDEEEFKQLNEALNMYYQALSFKNNKHYSEAKEFFEEAIKLYEKYERFYYDLGFFLSETLNDEKEAESVYLRAREKIPNSSLVNYGLALLYLKDEKRWSVSEKFFNEAIRIDPASALSFNGRGLLCYKQEKYNEAIQDFETSLTLDSKLPFPYVNLASIYQTIGLKSKSKEYGDKVEKDLLKPTDYYLWACLWSARRNKEKTLKFLQTAFEEAAGKKLLAEISPTFDWLRQDPEFKKLMEEN